MENIPSTAFTSTQQQEDLTQNRLSHGSGHSSTHGETPHLNGADAVDINQISGGSPIAAITGVNAGNRLPSRRPQTHASLLPSFVEQKSQSQLLTLTIHKDSNGYGMKVSGDNPVFVESVKLGGAAQKAGLVAGDMILKVNGVEVRFEKHTTVVHLIKSHVIVVLTIQRSQKMHRPTSVGISPSTPLPQRDRITAPQPVDNAKRREMEYSKIKTLQLMLEQEKKNLDNFKSGSSSNNRQDRARAETTIRKLQEQLRQVGGEDPSQHFLNSPSNLISTSNQQSLTISPQPQHSTPAFLSRFPRSLSSLSLGTRKKNDKETTSPLGSSAIQNIDLLTSSSPSSQLMHNQQHHQYLHHPEMLPIITPTKKKFIGSERNLNEDMPPPLPQRNPSRKIICVEDNNVLSDRSLSILVSDLDHSIVTPKQPTNKTYTTTRAIVPNFEANIGNRTPSGKKRPKTKALSDPKMSTQMFLQMEKIQGGNNGNDEMTSGNSPPPLPPRQPGMMEENQNVINTKVITHVAARETSNCQESGDSNNTVGILRPQPNSVDTLMNYPLVATCTAVRDNLSAPIPLSQRNIVQQLQQHQHVHHIHHNLSPTHSSTSVNKPIALGQTPKQMNHMGKHRRVVSSPEHMQLGQETHFDGYYKSASGSWELLEKESEGTPPGTPPPPYLSPLVTQSQTISEDTDHTFVDHAFNIRNPMQPTFPNEIVSAQANIIQREIISMEDEEISDQECIVDEHGPFNYLQRLLEQENVGHLAVFLNYVLSNLDPAPLLFYLITGLYKEGTVKDMRKWAYEIHSTFLVPCAPLLWFNIDESLAREVDNVLQNEHDKVEILRKVFWKSRKKAKEKICDQLRDFQQKRTAGLGTMYGPTDQQLAEAKGDKTKEQKIFEETLLPKLQHLVDELDKETPIECPKKQALCSALSTVLHRIFVTRSNPGSPIDRVHHFVSREKSFKSRLMGKSRKMMVRGHPLVLRQYYEVTHCNHCQTIIWGVSPQGYHCTDCKLNIHRPCSKVLEENCPGPVPQKRKEQHTDNKISKFMGKIRPTHHFIQAERGRRDDESADDFFLIDRPLSTTVVRQLSDRRLDITNTSASPTTGNIPHNTNELITSQSLDADSNVAPDAEQDSKRDRSKSKSAPVSVNRSESYKERLSQKRSRNNRRKTSDPSLSKSNDEQSELVLSNANYTASSSSSLSSSSLESPSTSLEQVGGPGPQGTSVTGGPMTTATGTIPTPRQWVDSEDETDLTEVDWSSNICIEILSSMSDIEKKRQEIINELYQTERNHVRTLRLLEGIFMRPLQESGTLPHDHLQLLFPPALLSLKDLHSSFEQKLKQRRIEHEHIVRNVGDLLIGMFEGKSGDELREYAAQFCARQQIALEALKEKRRKDENLQRLLTKAESHKACRRLQLKDLLPTVLTRLTKYPLLFESLTKITKRVNPDDKKEANAIQRALDSSKRILVDVNQAVKIAEDAHKLQSIQRKLDKTNFDKDTNNEFKNLDLTQHKLIHDGQLTMKKNPGVQLHGLLFENMMVLLQKQDDKYLFKHFPNLAAGNNDNINPITHFDQQTLVRQSAVDKNTFFLIITKTSQMLELTAPSSSECKIWFKHISDAAEQYKPRSKTSHEIVDDPATTMLSHSNTKESLESTLQRSTSTSTNEGGEATLDCSNPSYININNSNISIESKNQIKLLNIASLESQEDRNCEHNTNTNNEGDENDEENKLYIESEDSRRDSVYSNNSNNTRTLMQHCPLLEPTEIQINISPAHTAEPFLTPTERLRRLDESVREQLSEKQKIISDMFRVPNEHFLAIADIAGQPEAPKDSSDIALAAFAQVQSLTEVLNEYMKITPEQEISAVSTAVCDQCHHLNSTIASTNTAEIIISGDIDTQCNKEIIGDTITQDDDGYCEIDELRLPSVMPKPTTAEQTKNLKTEASTFNFDVTNQLVTSTRDFIKHEGTISISSISAESEHGATNYQEPLTFGSEPVERNESLSSSLRNETTISGEQPVTMNFEDISKNEHIEVNVFDADINLHLQSPVKTRIINNPLLNSGGIISGMCRPNRIAHVHSLEPSVPCHILSGFVSALSSQISLLLPKINERDLERERLRRENQHLRELLNSMHERRRVEEEKETPQNTKCTDRKEAIQEKPVSITTPSPERG